MAWASEESVVPLQGEEDHETGQKPELLPGCGSQQPTAAPSTEDWRGWAARSWVCPS